MSTVSITAERLSVALDQIKPTDGALWEAFANSFLSSEFPQLRPVGGIHDAGRDAFLYEPDGEPGVYVQHSTQETFEKKVRDTLEALQANSFQPRQLIYCSPRDIIKKSDPIKRELRLKGVALDIRDRTYFVTFRNQSAAVARHLPLAVDVAAVGLIPPEIKATVEAEIAAAENLPKYMRIRKIRDLLNAAKSPHDS
jgi:hypothetical protein